MANQNTKNDFLPDDYKVPDSESNYMHLEEGQNTFRVLSSAITGWEYWDEIDGKRKPIRVKDKKQVPAERFNTDDNQKKAKHFWAFVVFNPEKEQIQILELKQQLLMRAIESLVKNPKWGSPKEYDLNITKKKTGSNAFDVEYTLMPEPKEKVDAGVRQLYNDMKINLDALFSGKNPFDPESQTEDEVDIDDIPEDLGEGGTHS